MNQIEENEILMPEMLRKEHISKMVEFNKRAVYLQECLENLKKEANLLTKSGQNDENYNILQSELNSEIKTLEDLLKSLDQEYLQYKLHLEALENTSPTQSNSSK